MVARPLSLQELALAVDLGGTQVRAALVDGTGKIVARASTLTRAGEGPDVVIEQIILLSRQVCSVAGEAGIRGAGVSSPGPLDTTRGLALGIPTLKGFAEFPLRSRLAEALGLQVSLENDGVAAALGEWRYGAGKGYANIVYVTVSTGIGGGVIIDNKVLRGRRGMAGHIGHMSFIAGGELCPCGNRGCFEAYASGTALARRAARQASVTSTSSLARIESEIGAQDVFEAAAAGDQLARGLIDDYAHMLGLGFVSLMHLYSPDILIVGGGVSHEFETMKSRISETIEAAAMPAFRGIPVVRAALGQDSGLLGASLLVFDKT